MNEEREARFIVARKSLERHLVLVMHEQLAAVAVVADDPAVLKAYNVKKGADVD